MKIPKTPIMHLEIGAYSVPVYFCPEMLEQGFEGFTVFDGGPIILLSRSEPGAYITTLLHEAIHVIDWQADLNLSEKTVRVLEHQLTSLLTRNPVFHRMDKVPAMLRKSCEREREVEFE